MKKTSWSSSLEVPQQWQRHPVFTHLQPLAVVWDANDGKRYWSIGFVLNEIDEITIRVDHLLRTGNTSQNVDWVRPEHDDIQEVKTDYQVIPLQC